MTTKKKPKQSNEKVDNKNPIYMTNKKMPLGVDSQRHLVLNIANGYSVLTHTVTNK